MTPEERLLRLIRRHPVPAASGGNPAPVEGAPLTRDSAKLAAGAARNLEEAAPVQTGQPARAGWPDRGPKGVPALAIARSRWLGGRGAASDSRSRQHRIRFLQRVLGGIFLLNLLILAGGIGAHHAQRKQIDTLFLDRLAGSEIPIPPSSPEESKVTPTRSAPEESYEVATQGIQGRDLFRQLAAPAAAKLPSAGGGTSASLQNRMKELTLLGIVAGPTPQAIIDDAASKKSYFLKEGETAGDIRVVQILKGRVILEIQGEKQELLL